MLQNVLKLECKIGEKLCQLFLDQSFSTAEVKEALFQFQKYIGQVEDQMKAQQVAKEQEEAAKAATEAKPEPQAA
jgi:hypothetical protein